MDLTKDNIKLRKVGDEIMKKSLLRSFATRWAGSAAVVMLAVGVLGSSQVLAATGITNTKHNLTSTGTGSNQFSPTSGGGEICVFCHTPHGADTSASVPLWNRKLADPATYTTYNSLGTSSLDGATVAVGSVSIACLSCHDGAQAMNTMINQPGSGGYNAGGTTEWAGTWSGSNTPTGIALIGTDLQNDHPIGIQYAGGPTASSIPAAPSDYTGFKDADFKTAKSQSLNGTQVWWVENIAAGTSTQSGTGRQKTDLQLYTRGGATAPASYLAGGTSTIASTVTQPYVECASCHDPHTDSQVTFLRTSNTGSSLCLACHTK